jgi:hypothetical protein
MKGRKHQGKRRRFHTQKEEKKNEGQIAQGKERGRTDTHTKKKEYRDMRTENKVKRTT